MAEERGERSGAGAAARGPSAALLRPQSSVYSTLRTSIDVVREVVGAELGEIAWRRGRLLVSIAGNRWCGALPVLLSSSFRPPRSRCQMTLSLRRWSAATVEAEFSIPSMS